LSLPDQITVINAGGSRPSGGLKMQDLKMQDLKMKDQVARLENAGKLMTTCDQT